MELGNLSSDLHALIAGSLTTSDLARIRVSRDARCHLELKWSTALAKGFSELPLLCRRSTRHGKQLQTEQR